MLYLFPQFSSSPITYKEFVFSCFSWVCMSIDVPFAPVTAPTAHYIGCMSIDVPFAPVTAPTAHYIASL